MKKFCGKNHLKLQNKHFENTINLSMVKRVKEIFDVGMEWNGCIMLKKRK